MLKHGGHSQNYEVPSDAYATNQTLAKEVRVLLVDHDKECLISTARLLELYSYRVTMVELASTALSILSKGNERFDLIMANVHSPDMYGFQLLEQAKSLNLPVILMSTNEEIALARSALDKGAFLFLQKPISVEILVCLWQHVYREKNRMLRERELENMADHDVNGRPNGHNPKGRRSNDDDEDQNGNQNANRNNTKQRRIYRKRRARTQRDTSDDEDSDLNINTQAKRKKCFEWTKDLHSKFMSAVRQLGEGRCYPMEILKLMNVPDLTRMQVASHLQKCRNDNWKTPEKRKNNSPNTLPSNVDRPKANVPRRFGLMPLIIDDDNQTELPLNQGQIRSPEFYPPPGTMFEIGESSCQGFDIQLELESQFLDGKNVTNFPQEIGIPRGALTIRTQRDDSGSSRITETQSDIGELNLGSGTSFVHHYEPIMSKLNSSTPGNYPPPHKDEILDLEMEDYLVEHLNNEQQEPGSNQSPTHLDLNGEQPSSNEQTSAASNLKETKDE